MALILKKNNFLFVDGRYTVQANIQSGNFFKILTLPFDKKSLKVKLKNKKIGFDPRLFNENTINLFSNKLGIKCVAIKENLINSIKKDKINVPKKKFYILKKSVTGKDCLTKIKSLKKCFTEDNLDLMLITSPENVAWLLNIRGYDSEFSPIPNCFLIIDKQMKVFLFCDLKKIDAQFKKRLDFINIFEIDQLSNFLKKISNKNFLIDNLTCSIFYKKIIAEKNFILRKSDPIYLLKAQKNIVEINNTKKIHEYDGASLTKFLFWVQNNFNKRKING